MQDLNAWIATLPTMALAMLAAAPIMLGIAWAFVRKSATLLLVGLLLNRFALIVLLWKSIALSTMRQGQIDPVEIALLLLVSGMGWMFHILSMALNHDAKGTGFTRVGGRNGRGTRSTPRDDVTTGNRHGNDGEHQQ